MAISSITLVDTDLSTVLFDLHSADGASNSSWGSVITKFGLGGAFTVTAPHEAGRFPRTGSDGAFTTFARRGLGQASWRQFISGTTEANLRLGVGRLADLITRGTIFKIVTSTTTRFLRFEPSGYPTPYQGKDSELADIYALFKFQQGLEVVAACQPYWEGAAVSVAGVTVPDDPATGTKVRVFPVTGVTGDLPTPGQVRVQMDTGATVQRVLIAARARNDRAPSFFADYLSDTGFIQLEATAANRGWTGTLGTDTTATADTLASPGGAGTNMARVAHTTNPTVYARRTRHTRTTKLDSLRGSWDVWLRCKANAARDFRVQLRWGPSATADPVAFTNAEVKHDTSVNGTPPAFGYVELNLGRIYIPESGALGGLALEVWTRQASGAAANLDLDLLWLVPAEQQSTIVIPEGSSESWFGSELLTPVTNPAGGTAGVVSGTAMTLDTSTDNAGVSPNGGTVWGVGRHLVTFTLTGDAGSAPGAVARVRNITDSTDAVSQTVHPPSGATRSFVLAFDGVAGKAYQPQVAAPSVGLIVNSITHAVVPTLAINDSARTDPTRPAIDRLDSSGNIAGYLGSQGMVPVTLEPGDNHLMVRCDEIPLALYKECENKLARTPTVSVVYSPRFGF